MDDRTLTALKESIAHWERNVAADTLEDVRLGPGYCSLCGIFKRSFFCLGCPVSNETHLHNCLGTPYASVADAYILWRDAINCGDECGNSYRDAWRLAAQRELDFLRSLLPPEHVEPERVSNEAAE